MTRRGMPRTVLVLGLASLLNDVASEMVFPLLPALVILELGGNRTSLGLIEGAADSLASLLKLVSGHWSDRTRSRNRFIVLGYGMTAVLRPMISLVTAAWQVGAIRLADRLGKGIRSAPRDALIADSTAPDERGRAFGFNRSMDHAGAAVGPLLAALYLQFYPDQLRPLFALSVMPGLLLVVLVVWFLPRTPTVRAKLDDDSPAPVPLPNPPAGNASTAFSARFDGRFFGFMAALILFTLGNSSDAFLLVRASELGVAKPWLPVLWCVFHVAKSGGAWLMGGWADRWGPRRMIVVGWLWYAVVYLLFAQATDAWHVWALFVLYSVYYSLTESSEKSLVARMAPLTRRGAAFGIYNFSIGVATLPASILFGVLYDRFGALTAFGTGAGLALAASVLLTLSTRGGRQFQPEPRG